MIRKEVFLAAIKCSTQGWYVMQDRGGVPTHGERLRMDEGKEVHDRARSLHPNGVYAGSVEKTKTLVADPRQEVIFEAEFQINGYVARADWIRRVEGGWVIGEVKSSLISDESPKAEHIDDLAYTCMVLRRSGLAVQSCELVLMNRDWRIGQPDSELFVVLDLTESVFDRAQGFDQSCDKLRLSLLDDGIPPPHMCYACRKCEFFRSDCVGAGIKDSIFYLPNLREGKFHQLNSQGIVSIHEVPKSSELTDYQSAVVRAIQTGKPVIDREAIQACMHRLRWPVGYLDFETIKAAIPLYPRVAPHEQVVTQYSLHIQEGLESDLEHTDYLADHRMDCREQLAMQLLADTKSCESVITYSSFEKTTIRGLAKLYPEHSNELHMLEDKLIDLLPVVRNGVVHPDFMGRSSIKAVLPVLVPEMSYKGLEVADGDTAIAAFVSLALGKVQPDRVQDIRDSLLEYCKLDTLAMVRVLEALRQY